MSLSREVPSFAIDRPRLVERLEQGARGRLTLVMGPSGSGKSVLLRQWAQARASAEEGAAPGGLPPPWVRVDPTATDAVSFARQLVGAIERHHPGFGDEALRHLEQGGERMGPPFLASLGEEIAGLPPTTLVLEDVHELPSPLVEELGAWRARWPASLHVVVASRSRPRLSFARLEAQEQVTTILAPELAFTPAEVEAVVARVAGVALTADQVARLHARTEGWVVGVHLAALALAGGGDVDAELAAFGGAAREVADYLAEEVVAQQPPAVRAFLRRTSVLDRMEASLCDAVTGGTDGASMLESLVRRNLFVLPLDGQPGWYRYHQLFAEMLRYQLRTEDAALRQDLLVRAARWHRDRDEQAPAVEYLLRAQRWQEALDEIATHGWTFYERGESATAIRWLEAVPATERHRHHYAQATLITLHRLVGNAATADMLIDEQRRWCQPGSRREMSTNVFAATGVSWGRPPGDALGHAEAAMAWLDDPPPGQEAGPGEPPDHVVRCVARVAGARALMLLDRRDEARAWLSTGLVEATGLPPWQVRTLVTLARLEVEEGNLERAEAGARSARSIVEQGSHRDATPLSEAHLVLGQVAYERGRLDEAEAELAEAEALARVNRCTVVVATVVEARAAVALARGRPRRSLELLAAWRRQGGPTPPEAVLARLAAVEVRALLALDEVGRARRTLARAPQRVETLAAAAQVAARERDDAILSAVLERWPTSNRTRPRVLHHLWQAHAAHRAGRPDRATGEVLAAVAAADVEGHRQVFLDAGPEVGDLLEATAAGLGPARHPEAASLAEVCEALVAARQQAAAAERDRGQALSEREVEVLRHLGTDLTTAEIARRLGISTNTLKTHLKRAYRKLGVTSRRGAVEAGEELGLTTPAPRRGGDR